MAKKLLIDASHREERRMAVIDGVRLQNFETESISKKQLKSNIYLAKVIRIEPSLQAAFVEYGGNRQGFLPFGEIHPDYYQIPVGDRLEVEAEIAAEEAKKAEAESSADGEDSAEDGVTEDEDVLDEAVPQKSRLRYRYKIQEVIKRKQIMLVQVIREERGAKGAALTTYLTLAGKYCVMMPNSGNRTGGISRKIQDPKDRKRLRTILDSFDIPEGMSLIVRTAGSGRTKLEIKRDFDFLLHQWAEIRDKTLSSIAPALIYEEGDLIKRSLRDVYDKDVSEILIEGEDAYKSAKALMRTMLPSHAKKVQQFKDKSTSLFQKFKIEDQIDQMLHPSVPLPSGGSIVIAQTEALVAIDVNSGKSTRERHIDDTALKTNIEAAKEIARQMRLRDLAGLIVIDFIDMNERNHINQVERVLKESTQQDRARIQFGKISQFGLLEMSRQRLRPSLLETYTRPCETCHGTGLIRSTNSMALFALRQIEATCTQGGITELTARVPGDVDLYLLNHKRREIIDLETLYDVRIFVQRDSTLKNEETKIDTVKIQKQKDQKQKDEPLDEETQGEETSIEETPHQRHQKNAKHRPAKKDHEKKDQDKRDHKKPQKTNNVIKLETKDAQETSAEEGSQETESPTSETTATTEEKGERRRRRRFRDRRRRRPQKDGEARAESQEAASQSSNDLPKDIKVTSAETIMEGTSNVEKKGKAPRSRTPKKAEKDKTKDDSTTPTEKKTKGWWKRLIES